MAYVPYDDTNPLDSQTGVQVVPTIQANEDALRDGLVAGSAGGWTLTTSGGSAQHPAIRLWSSGVFRIRETITWTGNYPTSILWEWSGNSGSSYSTMWTQTATFDGDGYMTAGNNQDSSAWLYEMKGRLDDLSDRVDNIDGDLYDPTSVAITGGTIDAVAIGGGSTLDDTVIGNTTMQPASAITLNTKVYAQAFSSGAAATTTFNRANGEIQTCTLTGSGASTFAITGAPASGRRGWLVLRLTNAGLRTITHPTGTKAPGGVAPTLSSSGTDELVYSTDDAGATWNLTTRGIGFATV